MATGQPTTDHDLARSLALAELGWNQDISAPLDDLATLARHWIATESFEILDGCLAHLVFEESHHPKLEKKSHQLLARCWVNGFALDLPWTAKAFISIRPGSVDHGQKHRDAWARKVAEHHHRSPVKAKPVRKNEDPTPSGRFAQALMIGMVKASCSGDWERTPKILAPIPGLPPNLPVNALSMINTPDLAEIHMRKQRALGEFEAFVISVATPSGAAPLKTPRL